VEETLWKWIKGREKGPTQTNITLPSPWEREDAEGRWERRLFCFKF
jgi:hypothetical protein